MSRSLTKLCLFASLIISCRHNDKSQVKEFVPIPKGKGPGETLDFKLSLAKEIPHTVQKMMPKFSSEEKEDEFFDPEDPMKSYYSVSFGKLTREQFEKLQAAWHKNPKLSYDAARSYDLLDFMPPQIQALTGFRFKSERHTLNVERSVKGQAKPGEFYGVETLSNCWNAAYEVLRGSTDRTSIFYVDGSVAARIFTDDKYSQPLKTYPLGSDWKDPANAATRNVGLKPFDVLLVYGAPMGGMAPSLQHVAIYLDEDFYFEKTGPDSLLNYRFSRFSDIAEIYSEHRNARVEVRRLTGEPLPPARDVFSFQARGASFPDGFVNDALLQALPDLSSRATGYFPANFDKTNYSNFFFLVDVPLEYNSKTDRYALSKAAFQATLKDLPLRK